MLVAAGALLKRQPSTRFSAKHAACLADLQRSRGDMGGMWEPSTSTFALSRHTYLEPPCSDPALFIHLYCLLQYLESCHRCSKCNQKTLSLDGRCLHCSDSLQRPA